MEPPPAKRRRQFPVHCKEGCFDKLPDDLIEKIFCHLPLCSVFRSRCVSKRWLSISTSPIFRSLFERHHIQSEKDYPVVLLIQDSQTNNKKQLVVCSGSPGFNYSGFSLDFLPGLRTRRQDPITVVGSCDDLLLCCNKSWCPRDYFIVNSVTQQWIALPPTLRKHNKVITGFVCDPTSITEAKNGANLRYRVVRIPVSNKPETELNVEIFSSEDGQWNEYAMTCSSRYGTNMWCRAVPCNRSLYWKSKYSGQRIMVMDPFNLGKKTFGVIRSPLDLFNLERKSERLGVHRGKLRLSQTIHSNFVLHEPSRLRIWELERGEGRTQWRTVVEEDSLMTIVAANSSYEQLIRSSDRRWSWITLAVHPIDADIIYFGCTVLQKIISCNLKTSSLEILCDYRIDQDGAFPIVLPWWPTPVPSLPKP